MTPTAQNIDDQRERLATHRQNVQTLLAQIAAQGGWIHAPLEKLNTLKDQRAEIARCKASLRSWGQVVEDHPDDELAEGARVLDQQISELEASLRLSLPEAARASLAQSLQTAQERRAALGPVQATINVGGDAKVGIVVGVNLGIVIYGRDPNEDERRRLVWYLEGLVFKLGVLPLRGLSSRLYQGEGLAMPRVYTTLATTSLIMLAEGSSEQLMERSNKIWASPEMAEGGVEGAAAPLRAPAFHPAAQDLPARTIGDYFSGKVPGGILTPQDDLNWAMPDKAVLSILTDGERDHFTLRRALLASEAVRKQPRLVLLGDPGGGKSTFVRHLAWTLAQHTLDPAHAPALFGWEDQRELLPVIVPLRTLAARVARDGASEATGYAVLCDELHACCTHQINDALSEALSRGAALLLFDGLDEVPVEGRLGVADRLTTLRAVRDLVRRYGKCSAVLTCRTRAFSDELRAELGWSVETLAPFTLGQIRHFVPAWYAEVRAKGQIDAGQAERLSQRLLSAITDLNRRRLREMAQTPLLLTLMALILLDRGELPRDRPQLYEKVLDLLLGQWDQVREGQSLSEALGLPGWDSDYIRPLLDRLSYEAHAAASSEDGRGRLARGTLYTALIDFFRQARVGQPGDAALRCLDYIEQRSGLLVPDGPDSFVFAHLTLQEHCAGRQLVVRTDEPVRPLLAHRGDDRWREPILLGLGLARPGDLDRVLAELIDREEGGQPKPVERWYRDLILAAEIGTDRDWTYLRTQSIIRVDQHQEALRRNLALLLTDQDQPLPASERVRAGFVLGDLGDPRFPITLDEWQRELIRMQAGDTNGYFCRVEPGTYWIGSTDDDPEADDEEKPRHPVTFDAPFWIGRYPITNAQWQAWMQQGGSPSRSVDSIPLNHPSQPVVRIAWDRAVAFCTWLSKQLGVEVRLPGEAEWEAAARGAEGRRYPWGNEWTLDRAATIENREVRGWDWTVPVGCYPLGVSECGAQDMAGNVREWTADVWQSYPEAQKPFAKGRWRVLRGGSYRNDRRSVRCGARFRISSDADLHDGGFRVLVVPSRP